ncbi:MAG: hypothetical protein ACKO6N_26650 [Myxococcota bacterium]
MGIRSRLKETLRNTVGGVMQELVRGMAGVLAERMRDGVDPSGLPRTEPVSRQGTAGERASSLEVQGPKSMSTSAENPKRSTASPPSTPATAEPIVPVTPLPAFARVRVSGRHELASLYHVPARPDEEYTVLLMDSSGKSWLERIPRPMLELLNP